MSTHMISRRELIGAAAGTVAYAAQSRARYLIQSPDGTAYRPRLAARELMRGLIRLRLPGEVRLTAKDTAPGAGETLFTFRLDSRRLRGEQYEIASSGRSVSLTAAGEQGLLYAVYDLLERQGAVFGIDGETYPLEPAAALSLPPTGAPWTASPRFAVRGLLPWPDFLNCITVYNEEDFRAYFESMLRMRFNTFGMHVYTTDKQWAESYLSVEFAGVGHLASLDTTAGNRWGYLPQRTSRLRMGASQFYDAEVFGSDAARLARDPWETAERTRYLLRHSLDYARRLGIATGIGFEPYQIPDEIWRALPPEVRIDVPPDRARHSPRFDVESATARRLLEARIANLLESYPDVDYVWLWEDEGMSWDSQRTGVPLSPAPFLQAHDFLRRHAPKKRIVLAGWGGVVRHFGTFHKQLPGDVIFSALSDMTGWDPVHEAFSKLESRERWPIPWLEDDPGMWQAQFHASRFEADMKRAESFGCQGLMGIHWRHRIVDPTAGFQSRFSWDKQLTPRAWYDAYSRAQASGERAAKLSAALLDIDRNRTLLSSGTGQRKDGHEVIHAFSGDYNEAFTFWAGYEPAPQVLAAQRAAAAALRTLAAAAEGAAETERLEYLARHVEMLAPYADAWIAARRLHALLQDAAKLRKDGRHAEAAEKVKTRAVPDWIRLLPLVRETMLHFQRVVANRNDLGTLASMHNKFVRLTLDRLRLSIEEFAGELPPDAVAHANAAEAPDPAAPARVFLPTRPGILRKEDTVRLIAVVTGADPVQAVALHTRPRGGVWDILPAKLLGRRTYGAWLGPFESAAPVVEYFVRAGAGNATLSTPTCFVTVA
jgi:hypothetical protein